MEPSDRPRPRKPHPYGHAARLPEAEKGADRGVTWDALVGGTGPVEVEIGPGRGGFIFERAAAAPDARLVGFEIRLKWAAIVDDRLKKAGLGDRARVFAEDARTSLVRMRPDASVRAFFVHFPDPWWKKKHEKRLVVGDVLVGEIIRLLAPGGTLFVQTDVEDRALLYEEALAGFPLLVPAGDAPGSARRATNDFDAMSPRERRATTDGLPIHRLLYRRA